MKICNFFFDLKIDFLIEKSISGLKKPETTREKPEEPGKNSKIGVGGRREAPSIIGTELNVT